MSEKSRIFLAQFIQEEIYNISDLKTQNQADSLVEESASPYGSKSIVVATPPAPSGDAMELLKNILTSVGKSLEDIDHIELETSELVVSDKIISDNTNILLLFGGAYTDSPLYQIGKLINAKTLVSDSLDSIRSDKELKMKLWRSLKELF